MPNAQLGREEQMLAFFVQHCEGRIGRTQLIKFLYLADYEARRFLGRPISSVEYTWYHYGPYDQQFLNRISSLRTARIIVEEPVAYPNGLQGYVYVAGTEPISFDFASDELRVLNHVCETYSRVNLQSLLEDIVYETEPMRRAQALDARNQPLDMSLVDNTRRFDFGVPYDALIARSASARTGTTLEHSVAMANLRSARRNASA